MTARARAAFAGGPPCRPPAAGMRGGEPRSAPAAGPQGAGGRQGGAAPPAGSAGHSLSGGQGGRHTLRAALAEWRKSAPRLLRAEPGRPCPKEVPTACHPARARGNGGLDAPRAFYLGLPPPFLTPRIAPAAKAPHGGPCNHV